MFTNCTELQKVYPNGVKKGHAAYEARLDRDNDNTACEKRQGDEHLAARPPTSAGKVAAATGVSERLPQTGPGEVTAAGALIVLMGVVVTMAFRRRHRGVHFRA